MSSNKSGGCAKFTKAPDVSLNKPMKEHLLDTYN